MPTILVVEDDAPTRDRLKHAIQAVAELRLLGAVGTCREARASMKKAPPDVLLADLGLPDGRGDELIAELFEAHPTSLSLVITVFADEASVVRAVEAGASGYLLKDASPEQIRTAIQQLLDGGAPMSPSIARFLLKRFHPAPRALPVETDHPSKRIELTPREREVLSLAAKGFSFRECSELLGISPHTVTTHVRKIYRKLAVSSRGEAVYEAVQMGILDLDA